MYRCSFVPARIATVVNLNIFTHDSIAICKEFTVDDNMKEEVLLITSSD